MTANAKRPWLVVGRYGPIIVHAWSSESAMEIAERHLGRGSGPFTVKTKIQEVTIGRILGFKEVP